MGEAVGAPDGGQDGGLGVIHRRPIQARTPNLTNSKLGHQASGVDFLAVRRRDTWLAATTVMTTADHTEITGQEGPRLLDKALTLLLDLQV